MSKPQPPVPCPNCGAPTTGKFCTLCGEAMPAAAPAAPSAARTGAAPGPAHHSRSRMWTALSLLAFLALALYVAGRSMTAGPPAPPGGGGMGAGPTGGGAAGAAPDISQMSPAERAQRLHDLVIRAYGEHAMDTVQRFSPMAIAAYQMLDTMTLSQRYDLGRVALAAGRTALAAAQADTILARHRNDPLGLVLALEAARSGNDAAAERRFLARLRSAAPDGAASVAGTEYAPYRSDIDAALGAGGSNPQR